MRMLEIKEYQIMRVLETKKILILNKNNIQTISEKIIENKETHIK